MVAEYMLRNFPHDPIKIQHLLGKFMAANSNCCCCYSSTGNSTGGTGPDSKISQWKLASFTPHIKVLFFDDPLTRSPQCAWTMGQNGMSVEQLNRTQNTTCHATSMASMAMAHLLWPHLKTFWVNQGAIKNLRPRCWVCVAGSRWNVLKYFGFPLSWYCLSSDADLGTWNPWLECS